MASGEDKIKDLFSSKLGSFEPEVPASIWGALDQILSNQPLPAPDATSAETGSSTSSSSATTGKTSLIKTIAITAGLAAAVIAGILLMPFGEDVIPEPPAEVVTRETQSPVSILDVDTIIETPKFRPLIAQAKPVEEPIIVEEPEIVDPEPEIKEEPKSKPKEKAQKARPMVFANASVLNETVITKSSSKGISVGLTANAGLLSHDESQRGGGNMLFSHRVRSEMFNAALLQENSEFDLQHKLPLSFGVTISKQVAPRLSLETGLVYTYLSSKVASNSALSIDESQVFSYLGIPLSLNYNFYEIGKTKFYFSVGGMIQKDIYGKYTSNMGLSITELHDKTLSNIFYSEPYYIKETLKQDNPQFSVRTTLGVAYPLYKKLYLYGTIGGAYYFDAGNKYRTIYSDRKTQLDLNLGIKFDF
ncbi:hypothetical protein JGH11_12285 [Dysgonomonas sp. Marseille-P4677]|uniref:hypothetical protein n=1 Tax=Dysgonomonas sp. Marseille-P4677 TaxID=2364790 RepID=UPI0019126F4C|nr:hypothetical protein [Dysgonomonas sp. Marseille-P4677]MBK5721650.1 hypothetical protein [Dysgonomonas sp. Marseille-P4677]